MKVLVGLLVVDVVKLGDSRATVVKGEGVRVMCGGKKIYYRYSSKRMMVMWRIQKASK